MARKHVPLVLARCYRIINDAMQRNAAARHADFENNHVFDIKWRNDGDMSQGPHSETDTTETATMQNGHRPKQSQI